MALFLRDQRVLQADVIAVQEPWKNQSNDTTHQLATASLQLVYPKFKDKPGVCMFISKKIDPGTWSCQLINKDYQILKLRKRHNDNGDWTDIFIHNIYHRPGSHTLLDLRDEIRKRSYGEHVVLGDMNVHHSAWGGPGTTIDGEAEDLLLITDEFKLDLLTEEGKITWQRANQSSVLDLTFMSESLTHCLIQQERADNLDHQSDHFPVRTVIDIETPLSKPPQRRNWAAMDEKVLVEFIEKHCASPARNMSTAGPVRIELECQAFMKVIQAAIDASTPWAKPSTWSNPDFSEECREAVKTVRFLRRKFTQSHDQYDWMRYTEARNEKKRIVKGTLTRGHRRRVQQVVQDGPKGMWRLVKWARNRQGAYEKGLTPSLKTTNDGLAETVEAKATAFQQAFFPQPPAADLSNIDSYQYPTNQIEFPEITRHEIQDAVRDAAAGKAPGEDGIPNSLWHKVISIPVVVDALHQLFNACVRTGYNPSHFQRSTTVVLRKGGERDFQLAKSYRPIALLNTVGKFLEAVIARRISYAVEAEGLLPKTHLGGRRGISIDHAIQMMIDRIKTAWGRNKVVSLLLLDVSGAYDNVSHKRLLHNLKKRRLGHLVPWVRAFLTGRSTKIRLPKGVSGSMPTPTGIPQGSPISPILCLIYNADLIEDCCTPSGDVTTNGWVDDVSIIAVGRTVQQNIKKLQRACQKVDQWAKKHASVFNEKKNALIHFNNPNLGKATADSPLIIQGKDDIATMIWPSNTAERYLGFWLDPSLNLAHHQEKALIKAGTSLQALRSLAGSTWGASLFAMRTIYQAVIIPQMLYGVAAWFSPLRAKRKPIRSVTASHLSKRELYVSSEELLRPAQQKHSISNSTYPQSTSRWIELLKKRHSD